MGKGNHITQARAADETNKPYGCSSNFARFPIEIEGKMLPTSEHYFQAMKFAGTEHEEFIRLAPTAMEAAKIGRDRTRLLFRKRAEEIIDEI